MTKRVWHKKSDNQIVELDVQGTCTGPWKVEQRDGVWYVVGTGVVLRANTKREAERTAELWTEMDQCVEEQLPISGL